MNIDKKYLADHVLLSDEEFGKLIRQQASVSQIGDLNKRKADFILLVASKGSEYPSDMLLYFCKYWTEHSDRQSRTTKMRFEKEKTWNTVLRLERWRINNKNGKITTKTEDRNQVDSDINDILAK